MSLVEKIDYIVRDSAEITVQRSGLTGKDGEQLARSIYDEEMSAVLGAVYDEFRKAAVVVGEACPEAGALLNVWAEAWYRSESDDVEWMKEKR